MAIQRLSNDDFMSRNMDERLDELEERLTALYANASNDVRSEFTDFMNENSEMNERMRSRLTEGEITQEQYDIWVNNNIIQTSRYQATINSMTEVLVNTDTAAMAIVNGELPYVVAESYNFGQFVGSVISEHTGISIGTFQVYNARSVQALIRDNPNLLPSSRVDIPEDRRWNQERINREITHSLLRGESIPKVADRLQGVTNMDRNSAIRNARTSMTGAENLGRNESVQYMRDHGIDMIKEWSATLDNRTRETHMMLNGTRADENGLFGVGILNIPIEYPADPRGDPSEIYNCRCRLNIVPKEYSREINQENYERWLQDNYPDDYRALNDEGQFNKVNDSQTDGASPNRDIVMADSALRDACEQRVGNPLMFERLENDLNEDQIIDKVGGADQTRGSCMSLSCVYTANQAGYDVDDFRGGASQEFFSRNSNIREMANFEGVISFEMSNTNDFRAVHDLMNHTVEGRDYILATGRHAAIIRRTGETFNYLELQSANHNGWHELTDERLRNRFRCQRSHSFYGSRVEARSQLIDVETLGQSSQFVGVLPYLNTNNPMRGAGGHER